MVALFFRVNGHDIADKVQVPEGHPGLQRVHGDAAVRPQHVVAVELPDPLFRLLLELCRGGGEVRVLVAEELVGDLSGQQHPDVGGLMDGPAHQIHADTGPDGGDVIGPQQGHHRLQSVQNILPGDDHLGVAGAEIRGHLPRVFEVNGVLPHADGKGANGLWVVFGRNGAHQGGVQSAAEQKAHPGVGHQPLFHAPNQLFPDVLADGIQIVCYDMFHGGHVRVADEAPILIVVPGGEGVNLTNQPHQIFGLAGKDDDATAVIAVKQRPDSDGVPGGQIAACLRVKEDAGKLRIQHPEHLHPILPVQGQKHLAVGAADKGVFSGELAANPLISIDFTVAHHIAPIQGEGLHSLRRQAHDGKAMEPQKAHASVDDPAVVRPPGLGAEEPLAECFIIGVKTAISHDGTHLVTSQPSAPDRDVAGWYAEKLDDEIARLRRHPFTALTAPLSGR